MTHLREVMDDDKRVRLDEKEVDREVVEEKKQDPSIRIIEKNPNEFHTLHRLQG
jgi:hypothetical protein